MFDKRKSSANDRLPDPPLAEPPATPQSSAHTAKAAVLSAGIVVTGEISGSENIQIEGTVDGTIKLEANDVTIGRSGKVSADVSAKTIRVAGEVRGDLKAKERVVISGSGNVRGNVVAPRVVLEDGAIFKGSIDMDPGESGRAAAKSEIKAAAKPETKTAENRPTPVGPNGHSEPTIKAPDLSLKGG